MLECGHSHMDPNPDNQTNVFCYFPADNSVAGLAARDGVFFNAPNYAFFLPKVLMEPAIEWWRHSSDTLDYPVHINSGCQEQDHTIWPTAKAYNGWNIRALDTSVRTHMLPFRTFWLPMRYRYCRLCTRHLFLLVQKMLVRHATAAYVPIMCCIGTWFYTHRHSRR